MARKSKREEVAGAAARIAVLGREPSRGSGLGYDPFADFMAIEVALPPIHDAKDIRDITLGRLFRDEEG